MRIYLTQDEIKECILKTAIPPDQLKRKWTVRFEIDDDDTQLTLRGVWIEEQDY